jgi:hypothetical protein
MKDYRWVLFALLLAGCGDDDSSGPLDSEQASPITFGIRHDRTLDEYEAIGANQSPYNTSAYPDFSPVVAFSYSLDGSDEAEYVATGTLIDPHWILTAGHNFFESSDQDAPAPPSGISVLVGSDPNNPVSRHRVAALIFHPTWIEQNDVYGNANDLCLVQLADPIHSLVPAELNFSGDEPIGDTVWYCGFGDYTEWLEQDPATFSLRHAYENILDRKSAGIFTSADGMRYEGGLLAFDFDSPLEDINTLGDDFISEDEPLLGAGDSAAMPTEFEGSTVQGDSGGPLFIRVGNAWQVAGVLSGSPEEPLEGHTGNSYGEISIFTRLYTHRQWIETVLNITG